MTFCRDGKYANLTAPDGKEIYECNCSDDSYFELQARSYCVSGEQCRQAGIACGPSNRASFACCSGFCGSTGTCR